MCFFKSSGSPFNLRSLLRGLIGDGLTNFGGGLWVCRQGPALPDKPLQKRTSSSNLDGDRRAALGDGRYRKHRRGLQPRRRRAARHPEEVPLFSAPDGAEPIAVIGVDRYWTFLSLPCEGLIVRVHPRGGEPPELPTEEFQYEAPAAIVYEQRDR